MDELQLSTVPEHLQSGWEEISTVHCKVFETFAEKYVIEMQSSKKGYNLYCLLTNQQKHT